MAKSRKRVKRRKAPGITRGRLAGRDASVQLSADGVALSLDPVRNPLRRGTFGSIGRFYRVSSDRAFSSAAVLITYESREARFVDEATLSLFRWDEEHRSLVLVPECGVNVRERYVWGRISAPGIYGLIGLPKDERVLRTIALLAALGPVALRTNKALLPKVCGLILCARDRAGGGPVGGNLCDLCLGLEIPPLGLPEGQLLGKRFPERLFHPFPPAPKGAPWPMYGHDPRHTGRSAYPGPSTQPRVLWTFTPSLTTWPQMTSPQLSHPVVGEDGTVYVGASGKSFSGAPEIAIYALDGATGVRKWSQGWVPWTTVMLFTPQPAIGSDGTIYAVIGDMVFAFQPANGNAKWVVNQWNVLPQNPLPAADGSVYVFNWRYVQGSLSNGLFALDASGNWKWPAPFDTGMGGFLPMAVRDDGSVIVAGSHIWALESNRTVRWKHSLSGVIALEGSPAVADDGTVYVGVRPVPLTTANLRALDPNGNAKAGWTTPPWGLETPAIAADGTVYIGFKDNGFQWGGAKLDARNPDGSLKWSRGIPGEVPDAPAIGSDGTIYLASGGVPANGSGATVYALDPATGQDRWTLALGPSTWSAKSPAIGLNSTLYVTDASTGTLYALR